ncbi:hypothetical protein M3O57_14470 [Xanthomonas nasturtii]|uniref:hypothetical protein n=1 Tax=Xanthomonas nasturtii TaxID=1843581 RepID=UPI0011C03922|nr:hypothetical protein [Xanthomonas nasturtii]MCL1531432.1 hypothetical protein [Xanthomonas nasturtii]MCL1563645.1 hypothetical protein [Xanthomonas nasturtii]MCL1568640.1 hypothetical protein [Xanthomonas nasturtii]MCL1572460.1 hypothetical protein [Xanthomonas nasturtii]MCL1581823.1 hypothetical protein [Xanthomonas nasturtii]
MEVKKPGRNLFVRMPRTTTPLTLKRAVKFDAAAAKQKSMKKTFSIWASSGRVSGGEEDVDAPLVDASTLKLE